MSVGFQEFVLILALVLIVLLLSFLTGWAVYVFVRRSRRLRDRVNQLEEEVRKIREEFMKRQK